MLVFQLYLFTIGNGNRSDIREIICNNINDAGTIIGLTGLQLLWVKGQDAFFGTNPQVSVRAA